MFRRLAPFFRIVLFGFLSFFATQAFSQTFNDGARQGMVKVKFARAVSGTVSTMRISTRSNTVVTGMQRFDATAKGIGASGMYRLFPFDATNEATLRKHGLDLWYVVEIDETIDPKVAALEFRKLPEIEIAEIDHEKTIAPYKSVDYKASEARTLDAQPFNDPHLADQWHYNNTTQTGYGDADINLFKAWETTTGASDIIVSVHDEGVDVKHEDLKGNIWVNTGEIPANGIDDDQNGYIDDINGFNFAKNKGQLDAQHHGTHVAGTIAAMNNNGKGVGGIAGGNGSGNGVKIMSLEILGGGLIERSYVYAANNGAVISQNSWGYTTDGYYDQSVLDAIDYFIAEAGNYEGSPMRGGLVLFAAGNSNSSQNVWYPGAYAPILSVASIGPEWRKAGYSNYGPWVEISAPGGDQINYPGNNGVLSTIPGDKYAYMQGTSMACPHVSGIAALALSNRSRQLSSSELWTMLVTAAVSIDAQNEDYINQLGSGAIDAAMAIRMDQKVAPSTITDLSVDGVAQEFATLSWTVPTDVDDELPYSFNLYYHTSPITPANVLSAAKIEIRNNETAGNKLNHEVSGLLGLTTYYFAVASVDRWGNASQLSNVASASTNTGPAIAVSVESLDLAIEAGVATSATTTFDISNNSEGILRWESLIRNKAATTSFNASTIRYPKAGSLSSHPRTVGRTTSRNVLPLKRTGATAASFQSVYKQLSYFATDIIGETDLTLPNSAAGKFLVTEEEGFNLTDVAMYLKHDPTKGPVIVEVYKGPAPTKNNLLLAQEYLAYSDDGANANIVLDEQLYFSNGETFWIVFHVPADNLYPLGMGYEAFEEASSQCLISFNVGASWQPLEEAINDKGFAWAMTASSYNENLGTYITLDPTSGDVDGNSQTSVAVTADASALVNGSYSANIVLASNDAAHTQLRLPVNVSVTGHLPSILYPDIADFGAVFIGQTKTLSIELDNTGFGSFENASFTATGDDYQIISSPWSISARQQAVLTIEFKPTLAGNRNATLEFTDGSHTYSMSLFGVGAESSEISVQPEQQTISDITIGDEVTANITIENTGSYPLKYFVPGFDTKGVSENWPSTFHRYGYKQRSNRVEETNPIAFEFEDISANGIDITSHLVRSDSYFTVDLGFTFPYYGTDMHKIYIAQMGFTTFDSSVRPINVPVLNNHYSPRGYISLLGTFLTYIAEGKIYYKLESDKLIIQYDKVTDGYDGHLTAQMVLTANGDIRFYYDTIEYPESSLIYLNVMMESYNWDDGIILNDFNHTAGVATGRALGFDYPGPSIITAVANGSGIIAPGASADLELQMSTDALAEGTVNRYVNIISNDPANGQTIAKIELNIAHGGTAHPNFSVSEIAFGDVFQGAIAAQTFTIKNAGTAPVAIANMTFADDDFTLTGNETVNIQAGLVESYTVTMPTAVLGDVSDVLTIHFVDGTSQTMAIAGNVVDAPAITIDLAAITKTLDFGETATVPLTIKNTGLASLHVVTTGEQWLYTSGTNPDSVSYEVTKENTGGLYQWIDIRKSGTQLPFWIDLNDESQFWRDLTLPFEFSYFGHTYTKIKIGENGLVSFDEAPPMMEFSDSIPSAIYPGTYIMPYWAFAGFDTYSFKKEDVGIFYQAYDDRLIITWSYLSSGFSGMGDPVSAQMIMYRNGALRFQYRTEEGGVDNISNNTIIGLQHSLEKGIVISDRLALDFGKGLAYDVLPSNFYSLAPGITWSGNIVFDATGTYGGTYSSALKIQSDVPGSESLLKPVELTINGTEEISVPSTLDFGNRVIAMENGVRVSYVKEFGIANPGTIPFDITWIESATQTNQPLSIEVYALVDGWFGPEWQWADVSMLFAPWNELTPLFQLMPGDSLKARAVFTPVEPGDFTNEFVITSGAGEARVTLQGKGLEGPAMQIATAAINVSLNKSSETVVRRVPFNNTDGKSALDFSVSLSFDRSTAAQPNERIATTEAISPLKGMPASDRSGVAPYSTYNRTLKYTQRESPDQHVGTGGSAPFTVATRFNAGNKGFNLSHVETWFRAEEFKAGKIELEIRAGAIVSEAVTLAKLEIPFIRSGEDNSGNWMQLALAQPVFIYPNEDFFVLVTYPFEIKYPQGIVKNEGSTFGRYLYSENGEWFDLQHEDDFLTSAWLMYAAEQTELTSSWISVTSPTEGSLAMGEESEIELSFTGAIASPGDQLATIMISTNDPDHKQVAIPVKLHLNSAPTFTYIPDELEMFEMDTLVLNIPVSDAENNTITASLNAVYDFAKSEFENGLLKVTLTPSFGTAGTRPFIVITTDEYDASSTATVSLIVRHTNQPPVYVGGDEPIKVSLAKEFNEFLIGDYFTDPDNDAITFTAISSNPDIIKVFGSADNFLVQVIDAGNAEIAFMVEDSKGAITQKSVPITVELVLGVESPSSQGIVAFPNPADDKLALNFGAEWSGFKQIDIIGIDGRKHLSQATSGDSVLLEVDQLHQGLYFIRVTSGSATATRKVFIK
jgi:subtilisin family serine protease